MKVVRANLGATDSERTNRMGLYGNHVLLVLQLAFDQQKLFIHHHLLELLINGGRNDGVGNSRLIFNTEKDEAFGRAGALAGDDTSGNARRPSMRKSGKLTGGRVCPSPPARARWKAMGCLPTVTPVPEKSATRRSSIVICSSGEGRRCLLWQLIQQRPRGTSGILHLPQRVAAMRYLAQ